MIKSAEGTNSAIDATVNMCGHTGPTQRMNAGQSKLERSHR